MPLRHGPSPLGEGGYAHVVYDGHHKTGAGELAIAMPPTGLDGLPPVVGLCKFKSVDL